MSRILRGNALAGMENITLWHERDISHSSVERVIIPDSTILLDYMIAKTVLLIKNLLIYPEKMKKNLNLTRGLVFSQRVLLRITEKGATREAAYRIVQESAMDVWRDESKNLKDELIAKGEVLEYLTQGELEEIFDYNKTLKNIDYIFKRTVEA